MSEDKIQKRDDGYREGDVEIWYDSLKNETFNTQFIPLTVDDARAMIALFYQEETEEQLKLINNLSESIDNCINNFNIKSAFIRLSHLSPKDGSLTFIENLMNIFKEKLKSTSYDRAFEFIELNRSIYELCKCNCGNDAMMFFKKSNRTIRHLKSEIDSISDKIPWKMNIVVREWNDILPEYEFRAFVYKKKLTAITHYYKFCYVEDIYYKKDHYLSLMINYYNKIIHLLPENCVLDFCILPDTDTVKIVELNPWSIHASSALFSWDNDRNILEGNAPFEFRISEKPYPDILNKISSTLSILWQTLRPLRMIEGEDLPRNEVRVFYTFKLTNYKALPFYKLTNKYTIISVINWEELLNNICIGYSKDNIERYYWENSMSVYVCLSSKLGKFKNFEKERSPHWISTLMCVIIIELAIISCKGKKLNSFITQLLSKLNGLYQWLFDCYDIYDQVNAIKDPNNIIQITVSNTLSMMTKWNLIKKKK